MLDSLQDAVLKLQDQRATGTDGLGKAGPHFPDKVGGASQCLSIWFMALVHSLVQAVASCSIFCGVGVLPPHIEGLAASCRACLGIRFLIVVSRCSEDVYVSRIMTEPEWLASRGKNVLVLDFLKYEPAVVPAPRALRVTDHHPFRFVQTLRTKRIALGEPA